MIVELHLIHQVCTVNTLQHQPVNVDMVMVVLLGTIHAITMHGHVVMATVSMAM